METDCYSFIAELCTAEIQSTVCLVCINVPGDERQSAKSKSAHYYHHL